jgi:hypothetical protein
MIQINTNRAVDTFKQAFDRLRPVIITKGDKHIITSKGTKFEIPLSIHTSTSRGNTR